MQNKEIHTLNTAIDEWISLKTVGGKRWWETCVYLNGLQIGPIGTYPDEQNARKGHQRWVEHFPATPQRQRPLRLLVAEDNPEDTQHVLLAFEPSSSWELAEVDNGQAALELLQGGWIPDLFFLSINMPKLTGYEVLEIMKCDPKLQHVSVIMWSVSSLEKSMVFAYRHGVFSYLVKHRDPQMEIEAMRFIRRYWDGSISEYLDSRRWDRKVSWLDA